MAAGFVFYEDYYRIAKERLHSDSDKLKYYEAIFNRGLYGTPLPETGNDTIDTAFMFIETLLTTNEKRRENGKKGGRPKKTKTSGLSMVSANDNGNCNANANANTNINCNDNIITAMPSETATPDWGGSSADEIEWEDP